MYILYVTVYVILYVTAYVILYVTVHVILYVTAYTIVLLVFDGAPRSRVELLNKAGATGGEASRTG